MRSQRLAFCRVVRHPGRRSWRNIDRVFLVPVMTAKRLPETTAHVRILSQSWQQGKIEGEVRASQFEWQFQWWFTRGELQVHPSLGRALIREPLGRFLEQCDYQLEPGGDYWFTIRARL